MFARADEPVMLTLKVEARTFAAVEQIGKQFFVHRASMNQISLGTT